MIKTKRGVKSKPIFEYTFKTTRLRRSIPMLDGAGYARLITEEHYNYDYNTFTVEVPMTRNRRAQLFPEYQLGGSRRHPLHSSTFSVSGGEKTR
jgi:hypothetical protein